MIIINYLINDFIKIQFTINKTKVYWLFKQ